MRFEIVRWLGCRWTIAVVLSARLFRLFVCRYLLHCRFFPITILFSLPLSIGGAIAALLLTGKQLTTPVWIGILMLMGIVTKNAIMLVEFALESIRAGSAREEAIIDAGMKRARAREYASIPRDRFQPDMHFVRGFLDATLPIFGDTLPMMRTDFGRALQEAIMDDFFDNAEATLRKINERSPDVRARF